MSREKFEAWMTDEQWFHGSDFEWDERRNCYAQFGIHLAYKAWQAASKASEQQLAAVVVEKAGLKDINAWCKTGAFKNMYREFKTAEAIGCQDVDCMHDAMLVAIMHAPETPATDAYLAEVRAQGVDALSNEYRAQLATLPTTPENMFDAAHVSLRYQIFKADEFAAQLRQGAEHE